MPNQIPLQHFTFHAYAKNIFVADRRVACVSILVPATSSSDAFKKAASICEECQFDLTSLSRVDAAMRVWSFIPPHYLATVIPPALSHP